MGSSQSHTSSNQDEATCPDYQVRVLQEAHEEYTTPTATVNGPSSENENWEIEVECEAEENNSTLTITPERARSESLSAHASSDWSEDEDEEADSKSFSSSEGEEHSVSSPSFSEFVMVSGNSSDNRVGSVSQAGTSPQRSINNIHGSVIPKTVEEESNRGESYKNLIVQEEFDGVPAVGMHQSNILNMVTNRASSLGYAPISVDNDGACSAPLTTPSPKIVSGASLHSVKSSLKRKLKLSDSSECESESLSVDRFDRHDKRRKVEMKKKRRRVEKERSRSRWDHFFSSSRRKRTKYCRETDSSTEESEIDHNSDYNSYLNKSCNDVRDDKVCNREKRTGNFNNKKSAQSVCQCCCHHVQCRSPHQEFPFSGCSLHPWDLQKHNHINHHHHLLPGSSTRPDCLFHTQHQLPKETESRMSDCNGVENSSSNMTPTTTGTQTDSLTDESSSSTKRKKRILDKLFNFCTAAGRELGSFVSKVTSLSEKTMVPPQGPHWKTYLRQEQEHHRSGHENDKGPQHGFSVMKRDFQTSESNSTPSPLAGRGTWSKVVTWLPPESQQQVLNFSIGNILCVTLCTGNIADQTTDGIVNWTDRQLSHSATSCSRNVATKAGTLIWEACEQYSLLHGALEAPNVLATPAGGRLDKSVVALLHVVEPRWAAGNEEVKSGALVELYSNCFRFALELGLTSLSCPLVAEGNIPFDVCVQSFADAVLVFLTELTPARTIAFSLHLVFPEVISAEFAADLIKPYIEQAISSKS